MSAETLRKAAQVARNEWGGELRGPFARAARIHLAVAKAMDDVAHAWEIADEANEGWVYDADDNHYRFEETVDGGWLAVAHAYLGKA